MHTVVNSVVLFAQLRLSFMSVLFAANRVIILLFDRSESTAVAYYAVCLIFITTPRCTFVTSMKNLCRDSKTNRKNWRMKLDECSRSSLTCTTTQ